MSKFARLIGMPRETLRRKIDRLVEIGYVERAGRGLRITAHLHERMVCPETVGKLADIMSTTAASMSI
jgi:DNA-binding IclR family transcriptional regulator